MSEPTQNTTETVIFTSNAARKVLQLIEEEENFDLNLRVYINGGGCSGFQYGFAFEENINDDDLVVCKEVQKEDEEKGGKSNSGNFEVKLLIDPISLQYLMGAEIDYVEDLEGERFVIRNPNAETTCGCGSSFSASQ